MKAFLSRLASVLLACALIAAGCASDAPGSEQATDPLPISDSTETMPERAWAEEAERWTLALASQPSEIGGDAWRYFLDPKVKLDYRSIWSGAASETGESAFAFMRRLFPPGTDASVPAAPALISTESVIALARLDFGPSGMDTVSERATPVHAVYLLEAIGRNGAERIVVAVASDSWRDHRPRHDEADQADAYARLWVDVWSGDGAGVAELYHRDAVLIDSIGSRRASSAREISNLAIEEASSRWAIAELEDGTATVYPIPAKRPGVIDRLVLVVDRTDGPECSARLGLVLTVDDSRIAAEQRFWEIDTARECLPAEVLPAGWWIGKNLDFDKPPVATEDLDTVTGHAVVDGVEVEIRNGTDGLEAGVSRVLQRFELAGLPVPAPKSITFTEYSDFCDEAQGRARRTKDGWYLYFCFCEEDLCPADGHAAFALIPQHVLLHELAHVWLQENLSHQTRTDFMAAVGLEAWVDTTLGWEQQAGEYAAEVLAWGLYDRPLILYRFGSPTDEELHRLFELLTGEQPLRPAPD